MGWTLAADGVTALDPNAVAFPCGYVAYSFFNGSIYILLQTLIVTFLQMALAHRFP